MSVPSGTGGQGQPGGNSPPSAPPSPPAVPPQPPRRSLAEVAALTSAVTGVVGLLLGYFGLTAVVTSPTAIPMRVVETVTAPAPTVTVTVPASEGTSGATSPSPTRQASKGESLALQEPVGGESFLLEPGSGAIKGKKYEDALTVATCGTDRFTEYSLGTSWRRMSASIGLDDTSSDWPMTVRISTDGKARASVQAVTATARPVVIDVTGATRLRIEYEVNGGTCDFDNPPLLVIGTPLLER